MDRGSGRAALCRANEGGAIIPAMPKYHVYVDDNFHNGDEEERYRLGEFDTREDASGGLSK